MLCACGMHAVTITRSSEIYYIVNSLSTVPSKPELQKQTKQVKTMNWLGTEQSRRVYVHGSYATRQKRYKGIKIVTYSLGVGELVAADRMLLIQTKGMTDVIHPDMKLF